MDGAIQACASDEVISEVSRYVRMMQLLVAHSRLRLCDRPTEAEAVEAKFKELFGNDTSSRAATCISGPYTVTRPKNQHWVPQSYLRHFAIPQTRGSDTAQVWFFDKRDPDNKARRSSVRNLCAQGYLYSPIQESGERDWSAEEMLSRIEAAASKYWPELNESSVDLADSEIRAAIAEFVAAMQLRNVRIRRLMDSAVALRDKLGYLKADYKPKGKIDARDSGRLFAGTLQEGIPKMAMHFLNKRWTVLCTEGDAFLTSDLPLIYLRPGARGGPGTPDTTGAFPLGPRRVLLLDDRVGEPANAYVAVSDDFAVTFNRGIWQEAERHVITGRSPEVVKRELRL